MGGGISLKWIYMQTVLITLFFVIMVLARRGVWWYDTLFCYPLGMLYSHNKKAIDTQMRKRHTYIIILLSTLIAFITLRILSIPLASSAAAPVFCILLAFFSMKVQVHNKILFWLGVNSFAIYILQRLPMNTLAAYYLNQNNIFTLLVVVLTLLMAHYFTKVTNNIDQRLFK